MKILHTADLHLRNAEDERWRALEKLLEVARRESVPLLVVSGDMFDANLDARSLEVPLRKLFKQCDFDVVILPGNHDSGALARDVFYGDQVHVLRSLGDTLDLNGVRIVAFPSKRMDGREVARRLVELRTKKKPGAVNILLYHGELVDMVFKGDDYGEEGDARYMPSRLAFFDESGFDYVLAGHFHSSFSVMKYRGGFFVYPGSPVSITKREEGERKVNLFETGSPPEEYPLDTFHYLRVSVRLDPSQGGDPIAVIERAVAACPPSASIILEVSGHIDSARLGMSQDEFSARIHRLPRVDPGDVHPNWVDVGEILEHKLFKRFAAILDETRVDDETRKRTMEATIRAMAEALNEN